MKLQIKYSFDGEYTDKQVELALEMLLKKEYKICSYNETGEFKYSRSNDEKALWKRTGTYEDNSPSYEWVCWIRNGESILSEAAAVLSIADLNKIVELDERCKHGVHGTDCFKCYNK
jgi:hypothetical protein